MTANTADVFAERLLQVIDDGRRTATYKLALMLALMDACAAEVDAAGRAPAVIHTRTVARHALSRYLPQVRPFVGAGGDALALRQITGGRSAVLGAVLKLHALAEDAGLRRFDQIEAALPEAFEPCLDEVEYTFARYPVVRLQVVGTEPRPFLYDIDWGEGVTLSKLHGPGGGQIRFHPGAGDHLLRLAPLIRPLVEWHWVEMVARLNGVGREEARLHAHLFGVERTAFPAGLRAALAELQGGQCFYCGAVLGGRSQVDHFIPWSRWPNDAVENLVLADSCNTHKRDMLPALVHVDRWVDRLVAVGGDLSSMAGGYGWESDRERTVALARTTYAHLPAGTPLWFLGQEFREDAPEAITTRLATLASSA